MAFCLATTISADSPSQAPAASQTAAFPGPSDVEAYRKNVERVFLTDRGGTIAGYASCVMCHTWQTSVRFSLETPATDTGWTVEQSRRNFDVVTKLINTANPESSRLLLKPLASDAGGLVHTGGTYWKSKDDPEYVSLLQWIRSLPSGRYVPAPESALDFEFFRTCVQQVFATPREGQIRCSNCHAGGIIGFAPAPQKGNSWSDEEAKRAFQQISRLIIPGNAEQSRFMLKPLHPDGGGSYAHNGPRRWPNRQDPEWRMLAEWVSGKRTGPSCS
jgi:cytochrome c5